MNNNSSQTPPTFSNQKRNKKSRKGLIIGLSVAAAVIVWIIAAHFFGPDSERGIRNTLERLQKDSIALNGDFRPIGNFSTYQDAEKAIDRLRDLGDSFRFGHTDIDSSRVFSNPQLASLAKYNSAKCDSVLDEMLPLWRFKLYTILQEQFNERNYRFVVTGKDSSEIEVYCKDYFDMKEAKFDNDKMKEDAFKFNSTFRNFGFKKATYSFSPQTNGIQYDL